MKHFDTLQTAFRSFFPLYLKKYACISEKNVFNISLFFFSKNHQEHSPLFAKAHIR